MKIFLFLFSLLLFFSCKKDDKISASVDYGYAYFPVFIGKYIEYEVDSIAYLQPSSDTLIEKFRIKEVIEEVFTDNENRQTYKLVRYKKRFLPTLTYDEMSWKIQDVWTINKMANSIEIKEENIPYVKLIFPIELHSRWNGNVKNSLGKTEYEYTATHQPALVNSFSFDSTLTVIQKRETPATYYKNYEEKYAKGIGLIYKEIADYTYKVENGILYPGKIMEGISYKMKMINHN